MQLINIIVKYEYFIGELFFASLDAAQKINASLHEQSLNSSNQNVENLKLNLKLTVGLYTNFTIFKNLLEHRWERCRENNLYNQFLVFQ